VVQTSFGHEGQEKTKVGKNSILRKILLFSKWYSSLQIKVGIMGRACGENA